MFILYSALLVHACSVVPNSLQPHYAPLSVAFSRQESWSGLPFPTPGYLPYPGIEPTSPVSTALASGFYTPAPPGKPRIPTGLHQINAYSENLSLGCAFFKLSVKNVCCCFKKKKKSCNYMNFPCKLFIPWGNLVFYYNCKLHLSFHRRH